MDFGALLTKWNIRSSASDLLDRWREPHRRYHSLSHLDDLVQQINSRADINEKEKEILLITALFHDIIYDPQRADNEECSAKLLISLCGEVTDDISEIVRCILETADHKPSSRLSTIFSEMDMSIVKQPIAALLEWESGIAYEYSFLSPEKYCAGRIQFLKNMIERYPENEGTLLQLVEYIRSGWQPTHGTPRKN